MNEKFPEYKGLDLSEVNKEILKTWEENKTLYTGNFSFIIGDFYICNSK